MFNDPGVLPSRHTVFQSPNYYRLGVLDLLDGRIGATIQIAKISGMSDIIGEDNQWLHRLFKDGLLVLDPKLKAWAGTMLIGLSED